MKLRFDPKIHAYFNADGRRIPGVTEVLSSIGIIETTWFTEEAAWRGSVIHSLCELDDKNNLADDWQKDYEKADAERLSGFLDAWRLFRRQAGIERWDAIEEPEYFEEFGYAGRPDRKARKTIWDLKTGGVYWWTRYQLAGYSTPQYPGRAAVRLTPDTNPPYKIEQYPVAGRRRDFGKFLDALSVHNLKQEANQ